MPSSSSSSHRLLLGTQAPVMMPNGVDFSSLSFSFPAAQRTNLLLEAHVQQAVSLIQHQPPQLIRLEGGGLLQVVQQPAGAGHQHRDALPQPGLLLVALLTTKNAAPHLQATHS